MRALPRVFGLSLLIALAPSLVPAQEQIPRELALALIPYAAGDGGEIIVGQIPPDLATTFTLPAGGRVLGSFVSLTYAQVVMTLPGSLDSAAAFARRSLTEHGWVPRPMPMMRAGGLQYGSQRNPLPATYCKAGSPDAITISTQFHGQTTLLRLTRNTGSSMCDESRMSGIASSSFSTSTGVTGNQFVTIEQRMAERPMATVPPLWSPGDVRASQVCRSPNGMATESQEQPLRSELSPQEILAHYGRQLDSAGWKSVTGAPASVAGTWADATNGQEVTISVTKLPSQSGCYQVTLRATARRSTK
ncbi:MAG TPA: hypothetical protein VGP84_02615 [Gemmatimonadaceae bacterium]|jgi:hypothetical protein|nr:hypothetical protein [Gemmatimonadaceae bacterium]